MYKIIACDLDETLLSADTHVSVENREAIQKAVAHGVKFVPATGRGDVSVQNTLKEIGLEQAANEYVISFNGASITENKNNRVLYFDGLPNEIADRLYRHGVELDIAMHVYTQDMVYTYHIDDDERAYMTGRHQFKEIEDKDLSFLEGQKIAKVLYESLDNNYLHRIAAELGPITQELDISYSSNRYLEFNRKGVNKGAGLMKLAEQLRVPIEETIYIGDNFNELAMIEAAGVGVGVANVNPAMIEQCDYITQADNNHGAVAEAIDHFIFNN